MTPISILLGVLIIVVGLVYIIAPKKIYPYDKMKITKKGVKEDGTKMTDEWLKWARMKGLLIVIGGFLILCINEIVYFLYGF